jgi:mono/diheme cytochrome c family protein
VHTLLKQPLLAAAIVVAAACGAAPSEVTQTTTAAKGAPVKVNLDEIFPQGAGRDLVLENCQNCHTFVPLVVLQMNKEGWQRNSLDHRERVTTLTDDQFKIVYEYLTANFGPHRPVPRLPKELLKTWTGY